MTPARRGRALGLVMAAGVLVTAAACGGIPSDDAPTLVAADEVPSELSESSTTTTPSGVPSNVYLVSAPEDGEERLLICVVSVERDEAETQAGAAVAVLRALTKLVPTESRCFPQLINSVPPDLEILDAEVEDRILVLDLANLTQVQGVAARRAIAQIVFTATAIPGIDGVRFRQEGKDIAVNVSDGRTLGEGEAVYPSDFPKFQELENTEATSTTTTTAPPPVAPPPAEPAAPAAPA